MSVLRFLESKNHVKYFNPRGSAAKIFFEGGDVSIWRISRVSRCPGAILCKYGIFVGKNIDFQMKSGNAELASSRADFEIIWISVAYLFISINILVMS